MRLNFENLTNLFLDHAEEAEMGKEHSLMMMQKWIDIANDLIKFRRKDFPANFGSTSHKHKGMYLLWMRCIKNILKRTNAKTSLHKLYHSIKKKKINSQLKNWYR